MAKRKTVDEDQEEEDKKENKEQEQQNKKDAQQNKKDASKDKKRKHTARNVGLLILLILVIIGVYFYYAFLSGGIVTAVYQTQNPNQFKAAMLQQINSHPKFNLSYAGTVKFNTTSYAGTNVSSVTLPFTLSYLKYNGDKRVTASFIAFPKIGNYSAVGVSLNNGTTVDVCYNHNETGYFCYQTSGSPGQIADNLSNAFNITRLGNLHIKTALPSYYNGIPCWYIAGTGDIYGTSVFFADAQNSSILFDTCFSSKYYVPLYANATIIPNGTGTPIHVSLREVNLSQNSTESAVVTLPANISK
jgi:hypothetical protein